MARAGCSGGGVYGVPPMPRVRRLRHVLAGQVLLVAGLRVAVLQPESCPAPTAGALDTAIAGTLAWFGANQQVDGRWLYRYDATATRDLGGYNLVRHAGVLLALEQAVGDGHADAAPVADAGWQYLERHRVATAEGGLAVSDGEGAWLDVGASALAASAWALRLARGGPPEPLRRLGAFLVGQLEANGAVAGGREPDGTVDHRRSRFSTGEVTWALQRLATSFPGDGFDEPADRALRYLVLERDGAEDWFPAIADHWGAYALASRPDAAGGAVAGLPPEHVVGYRRTLAGRFSVQVRWESQRRPGRAFSAATRGRPATGAAIGTLGEGLGQLAGSASDAAERRGLERQLRCAAGLLVARQDRTVARDDPDAGRRAGAWFAGGVTQMDDQQHALSALLAARRAQATVQARAADWSVVAS